MNWLARFRIIPGLVAALTLAVLALSVLALSVLALSVAPTSPNAASAHGALSPAATEFPIVDPDYIYSQLDTMTSRYQRREAGFDTNLPPNVNGHDEFAAYWVEEMKRNLAGFGPTERRDAFQTGGWRDVPPVTPAVNVEITVPGVVHPQEIVIVGCHYDAEATSTQSAFDDASGCAIELGVARALGEYWRAHNAYPARTLRFVLYDAEEQGLYGSFHAVNASANGDLPHIVAMINEEQNGIAYPLRFLGDVANPQLPFYADLAPATSNDIYPAQNQLPAARLAAINRLRLLVEASVAPVFAAFRSIGASTLDYTNAQGATVSEPVFTPEQQEQITIQDDTIGGSDHVPFTLAGVPTVTFIGNYTYYSRQNPPRWSYPYDRPEDRLQLMNIYASGSPEKSRALALALALPGMMTTYLLHQQDLVGSAPPDGKPIVALGDIAAAQPGVPLALDARPSLDPQGGDLHYTWDFGDGTRGEGIDVSHTYAREGHYTLRVTARSAHGSRTLTTTLDVTAIPRR